MKITNEELSIILKKAVFNRREAAVYLGVSPITLDRLPVPKIKIRKRVLYRRESIDAWLVENEDRKEPPVELA